MVRDFPSERNERILMLLFLLFFAGTAASYFWSDQSGEAIRKIILKTSLLFFPLQWSALRNMRENDRMKAALIFIYAMYLPAVVSVYNYFLNRELFDALILESKPLPVEFGYGIYHIQFSILLGISVCLGAYLLTGRDRRPGGAVTVIFLGVLTALNFIFLHVLSARTGLVACYAGLLILAVYRMKKLPAGWKIAAVAGMVALPAVLIITSTSLQNRLRNSARDLQVVWQGADANDYSFAMRVRAWKNAVTLIGSKPWTGSGIGDAERDLFENFSRTGQDIKPHNRKNPHMQLLESAVQSGLPHALVYLAIILMTAFGFRRHGPLPVMLATLLFLASCFESILERQVTVVAFPLFLAFALAVENDKESE